MDYYTPEMEKQANQYLNQISENEYIASGAANHHTTIDRLRARAAAIEAEIQKMKTDNIHDPARMERLNIILKNLQRTLNRTR